MTTIKSKAIDFTASSMKSRNAVFVTEHCRPDASVVDVGTFEGLIKMPAILKTLTRGERALKPDVFARTNPPKNEWLFG